MPVQFFALLVLTYHSALVLSDTISDIIARARADGIDIEHQPWSSAAFDAINALQTNHTTEPPGLGNATKIDVHVHAVPRFYFDIMPVKPSDEPWTVSRQFEHMASLGIAHSILSLPWPGASVYAGNQTAARALARITNEYLAEVVRLHPKRFSFMAVTPLPFADAALREVQYALDTLGAIAIGLFSNHEGHYLGDPILDPFFAGVNSSNLTSKIVFIHPALPTCPFPVHNDGNVEFYFDTATALMGLTLSKSLQNFTSIKYILSHGGGATPSIIDRMFIHAAPEFKSESVDIYRKRVWYDSAGATYPRQIQGLLAYDIPKTQLLYGSDFPFNVGPYIEAAQAVADADFLTDEEKLGVFSGNSLVLFPELSKD
ncbi:amidohydrolase 2 [Lophiostoma macrostomum CBS 122681]|uniref:Amidohydrolase 2 n=1 Tax=Lophiostoma macrostomum CBS 122681 TaxID=1314788 RepID=A0A6A6TIE8_9PLEO|nr:amidohydrolase 2 [Lophiostoma macrostomum CBS 122681]